MLDEKNILDYLSKETTEKEYLISLKEIIMFEQVRREIIQYKLNKFNSKSNPYLIKENFNKEHKDSKMLIIQKKYISGLFRKNMSILSKELIVEDLHFLAFCNYKYGKESTSKIIYDMSKYIDQNMALFQEFYEEMNNDPYFLDRFYEVKSVDGNMDLSVFPNLITLDANLVNNHHFMLKYNLEKNVGKISTEVGNFELESDITNVSKQVRKRKISFVDNIKFRVESMPGSIRKDILKVR